MTIMDMLSVVANCAAPGMTFNVHSLTQNHIEGDPYYLQVEFDSYNSWDRTTTKQKGRKWLLSEHMTKNELVQTCFLAVMTAAEHEVRENFRYKGRPVFGPHWNPDVLWKVARRENLDLRVSHVVQPENVVVVQEEDAPWDPQSTDPRRGNLGGRNE